MRLVIPAAATAAATAVTLCVGSARADGGASDKKIVVGGDVQLVVPVGDFSDSSGPEIGAVARGGYLVTPQVELTGRIGYLAGLNKSTTIQGITVNTNVSNIPIWLGARYYFQDDAAPAGFYGAAELALNFLSANVSAGSVSQSNGVTRAGFNLGAGYVISRDLPIDIRAQFMFLNLLGTDSGEKSLLGIGVSGGYSFFL